MGSPCHSSSAPTILQSQVGIPSTPSTLFHLQSNCEFYVSLCCEKDENYQKEAGLDQGYRQLQCDQIKRFDRSMIHFFVQKQPKLQAQEKSITFELNPVLALFGRLLKIFGYFLLQHLVKLQVGNVFTPIKLIYDQIVQKYTYTDHAANVSYFT